MPTSAADWTTEQVARWLQAKRVPAAAVAIVEQNDIVGEDLLELDRDELVGLGIDDSVASKIASALPGLANGEDEHAALVDGDGEVDPSSWSPDEVEAWAKGIPDIARLAPTLAQNGVDGGDLLDMTVDDALALGLTAFKARKLVKRVRELMGGEGAPTATATPGASPARRQAPPSRAAAAAATPERKEPEAAPVAAPRRPQRRTWPPGEHVVPHKVVVINRAKAMEENPLFRPQDFTSLHGPGGIATDTADGGELKTILVVGATGAGKSTMVNSMVNYLYQVEFADPWRLRLIQEPPTKHRKSQADSMTNQVFGYVLDRPPALGGKDSLMIIDTPGFGDSRGVARDEENIEEIKKFFETEVPYLHAVCFVIKAPDCRMTHVQKWIFDKILGLFGKDIEGIITLLFTFADAQEPPALAAVKAHGIAYKEMFKLNNSAYFLDKSASKRASKAAARFNEMFWELGQESFHAFVGCVQAQQPQSLTKTRQVLKRREELKVRIEQIHSLVAAGLAKLDELEQTIGFIVKNQSLIEQNKDFHFYVKKSRWERRPKPHGSYVTICDSCKWTCHQRCSLPDARKMNCAAMDGQGHCTSCPNKCVWHVHKNKSYVYVCVQYKEKQTNDDLYKKYTTASSTKSRYEQALSGAKGEFQKMQQSVFYGVQQVREAVNELQQIALRPNTFHSDEYFDLMIEQEKHEKKNGWRQRVKAIEELKARSKALSELTAGDFDPFTARCTQLQQEAQKGAVTEDRSCLVM